MPEVIVISQGVGTDDDKISRRDLNLDDEPIVEIIERPLRDFSRMKPDVASKFFSSSDEEHADKVSTSRKSRLGPTSELLPRKRDRSPILFARARLGLSEGSAFSPVCQDGSPSSSRRAKSLDAPVVAVHRLPPADAFSCNDDTLDNGVGKPLQIIAIRVPSTIEDENDTSRDYNYDTDEKQIDQGTLKKEIEFLHDKTSLTEMSIAEQSEKQELPFGSESFKVSFEECHEELAKETVSSVIEDHRIFLPQENKEAVENIEAEYKQAVDQQVMEPLELTSVKGDIKSIVTDDATVVKPEVPLKPAGLKAKRGSESIPTKGKIEISSKQVQDQPCYSVESQKEETVKQMDRETEIHFNEDSLNTSQGVVSEKNVQEVDSGQKVSSSMSDLPEIEQVQIKHTDSINLSVEFDDISRGRKLIKGGSSGEYQTFDDIELPFEFRDHPADSEIPKQDSDSIMTQKSIDKYSDNVIYDKQHPKLVVDIESHSKDYVKKESIDKSISVVDSRLKTVPEVTAVQLPQITPLDSEIKSQEIALEMKPQVLEPVIKKELQSESEVKSKDVTESMSEAEISGKVSENIPTVSHEKDMDVKVKADIPVPVDSVHLSTVEPSVSQTSSRDKSKSSEQIVVKNIPVPCVHRGAAGVHSIPHKTSVKSMKLSAMKREPVQIIRIDTHSPEKEEAIVTSDDEVPAIPLDEEGTSLERWVSVEDIHEELLAADHALKGALDLGHEFQYIDDDDRRSPDTCSDYDNLSSSSPSSHVLAQDSEPPLECAEEFVEIELIKKMGQKEEHKHLSSIQPITASEIKAMIATEESDSTLSSTAKESKSKIENPVISKTVSASGQEDTEPMKTGSLKKESDVVSKEEVISPEILEPKDSNEEIEAIKDTSAVKKETDHIEQQKLPCQVGESDMHELNVETVPSQSIETQGEVRLHVTEETAEISDASKTENKPRPCVESPESLKDARDEESPESTKDDKIIAERSKSEEEASTSSSLALPARVELSSTWRPFLLESSGSSSLEEGFFPPDEEETTSSPSNNDRDDGAATIDFPATFGYPCIGDVITGVGGYGGPGVFALSRTLSRISERSTTSEQERSDVDDDSTKPSSRSPSVDDESLLSSDHQPSLSSDPPSGGPPIDDGTHILKPPDIPQDQSTGSDTPAAGPSPGNLYIPPPLLSDDDWPSPPTSSSLFETPVVSHVETFYMEIHPEEACKVLVIDSTTDPTGGDGSSTDENHTLQDEDEDFLSGECLSSSATTLDGTVKVAVRPKCPSHYCAGSSLSEDTSMGLSLSEWSSSTSTVRPCPLHYSGARSDDTSLDDLGRSIPDLPTSSKTPPTRSRSPSYYSGAKSDTCLDDGSPTRFGKPTSGQKSRITYYSASKSLTSVDKSLDDVPGPMISSERPVKVVRPKCTPYYSTARSDDGDRIFERAVSRQTMVEQESSPQSIEAPSGWSDERSSSSHSMHQVTGPKVRSKCYSYYSTAVAARSPQSDGDTSSSLDGSNVTERVSRAPKRRKSQPKKRHRVTVDLEVRDGQIVEVSTTSAIETRSTSEQSQISTQGTAESTSAVLFVPKQSSV
ncbi:hypothetical protein C0J52_15153 [Blattella germanica]|nr:hypothetical protein C0J52_15153 [Blattella germanica]